MQHELYGHGYRLREFGAQGITYSIEPWSGWTSWDGEIDLVGHMLAIDVAGLEAEAILARDLKMRWIAQRKIEGRIALLYTRSAFSLLEYTFLTYLCGDIYMGNDVYSFSRLHRASYPDSHLTVKNLVKWAALSLLDPMTFYAEYAFFHYIAEGTPWEFPMITFKEGVDYLPNVRIGYAPYGVEAYLENFFSLEGDTL